MEREYWLRQDKAHPLFPELEWSRPENRAHAGKLLVVGGNLHGFAAPAEAYAAATKAGIGTARVLLPQSIQKITGPILENGEFAPATPSGSFSQKALNELLVHSNWADAVLCAGDLGRNSETAILLETFLQKYSGPVTLTKDAVDYAVSAPQTILERPHTLLVLSLSQLQRLAIAAHSTEAIRFSMDLLHIVEWLHDFTATHKPYIIVKHLNQLLVAVSGQVSSTTLAEELPIWRVQVAGTTTVWWVQNQSQPFKAISVSVA